MILSKKCRKSIWTGAHQLTWLNLKLQEQQLLIVCFFFLNEVADQEGDIVNKNRNKSFGKQKREENDDGIYSTHIFF